MWLLVISIVVGLLGAVLLRLLPRSGRPRLPRTTGLVTALAAGASFLIMTVFWASPLLAMHVIEPESFPWDAYAAVRFVLPLVLGVITVLLLGLPARSRGSRAAQLTRRTWTSFLSGPWLVALGIVLALVLAITVSAGLLSERDEDGHFTRYVIKLGSMGAETDFYGWHYSLAPMIVLAVLITASVVAWARIARPPHPEHVEQDVARRRLRSTNIARVAIGALLLHLASALRLLGSTASFNLTAGARSGEYFSTGSAFSDLAPLLEYGAPVVAAIGMGLWAYTALSALPLPAASSRESE